MSEPSDILYSYEREEDTSTIVLTSAGTEDTYREKGSSTTRFHKDCYWIIETDSKKTKFVIDNLCVPSFDMVHFSHNYFLEEDVNTGQLREFLDEISNIAEEWEFNLQLRSAILKYKYRTFTVENCYGDCVSVEYPLIGIEVYLEGDVLHHISYGGSSYLTVFRDQFLPFFAEECRTAAQLDGIGLGVLGNFNVSSVVMNGYSLGTLLHEAVGHLLEFDHAKSLKICKGDGLTGPAVTVNEVPGNRFSFGFCPCSDEGTEPKKTALVQHGVIQNFLTSLSFSEPPYQHGRAQRCADLPLPRNTSLSMEKGKGPEDVIFQSPCALYIHKGIKPTLLKIEDGNPFFDVEVPTAYVVEDETVIRKLHDIRIFIDFKHFFDGAVVSSKVRGNQVGYCVKSQQQIESTQFAPDVNTPVENIQIHTGRQNVISCP